MRRSASPASAEAIATPGPATARWRTLTTVWHSSQWTVDQSSALVICSAERAGGRHPARALAVPPRGAPLLGTCVRSRLFHSSRAHRSEPLLVPSRR